MRSGKALLRPYFIVNTAEKLLGPLNCDGLVVKSDPIPAYFLRRLRHPLNKAGSKSRFHTEAVAKGSKKRSTTMKRNMNSLKRAFTPTMTLAVALAILIFIPTQATAHASIDTDACTVALGQHLLNVAAYQSGTLGAKHCGQLPKTGQVSLFIDFDDRDLRRLPIAVDLYEGHPSPGEMALVSLPAQMYPQGSIAIERTFDAPGEYTAVIVLSEHGGTIKNSFSFTVGNSVAGLNGEAPIWIFFAMIAAAGAALYRVVTTRSPAPARPA